MRYWVYINDEVNGPYEEDKLVTLEGFSKETLICSEDTASNGGQDWVKASSIFEFDEIPAPQELPTTGMQTVADLPTTAAKSVSTADTQALLAKLDSLTKEMSNLHQKLDSMQSHLDKSLQENNHLLQQAAEHAAQAAVQATQAAHETASTAEAVSTATPVDERVSTITLTQHAELNTQNSIQNEELSTQQEDAFPMQAAPKEDELIIRSALDSIYGEKIVKTIPEDETFQDLLPEKSKEKEEKAIEKISEELTFTPVEEKVSTLREAIITTPSADEAAKDALINELTASPKEDVLDQIIQEHQEQPVQEKDTEKETPTDSNWMGIAAAGATVVGAAGIAAAATRDSASYHEETPMAIATDKNSLETLEEVLPASQMPADVPTQGSAAFSELPTLDGTPVMQEELPHQKPTDQIPDVPAPADTLPELKPESEIEELVVQQQASNKEELPELEEVSPAAQVNVPAQPTEQIPQAEEVEDLNPVPLPEPVLDEAPARTEEPAASAPIQMEETEKTSPANRQAAEFEEPSVVNEMEKPIVENAVQTAQTPAIEKTDEQAQPSTHTLTDKDLQDAFGPEAVASSSSEPINNNPNDLTEIELKEGSTYLISDFVPPAQMGDETADKANMADNQTEKADSEEKLQEALIQDMLAVASTGESTRALSTDGLPEDASATQIRLENTIQAKRGAALDIKTVPMVPEPANAQRLDMNDIDDVNAQHDMKTAGASSKLTKMVIGALVGLLLLIVLYVLLGLLNVLPSSLNLFAKPQPAAAQATEELLTENTVASVTGNAQDDELDEVLTKVQKFPLPNGMTLAEFIENKHAPVVAADISWEIANGVEEDNYSITVKVPPENPQNFKTVYRFNYNVQSGLLEPTISDAKNLLDQAYGQQ